MAFKNPKDTARKIYIGVAAIALCVAFAGVVLVILHYASVIALVDEPGIIEERLPVVAKGLQALENQTVSLSTPKTPGNAAVRGSSSHMPSIGNTDGIDDTVTDVVVCRTTQGNITIDIRGKWSPKGRLQYLKLLEGNRHHFNDLPFSRVAPRYIMQFGRKYVDAATRSRLSHLDAIHTIPDDTTLWGKRDMDFGYIFFAGNGKDSRYDEMVIALCKMKGCRATGLGKAFWETPVGTIRKEGFDVLHKIEESGRPYPRLEMAGQHPKANGPNLGKVVSDPSYLKTEYPFMEYWKGCEVIKSNIQMSRPLGVDHPESVQIGSDVKNQFNSLRGVASDDKSKKFIVNMQVSNTNSGAGEIVLEIDPHIAPLGAQRFKELIQANFYEKATFFRVIKNFMAQWGIPAHPQKMKESGHPFHKFKRSIRDDPSGITQNSKGTVSFATSGKHTRAHQLFINLVDNPHLDKDFVPIGKVIKGMDIVDALYAGYGEGSRSSTADGSDGRGPNQMRAMREGNEYLNKYFPKLSYITTSKIV